MNIILLGPQGSGKGTQADLVAKQYGLKHISTGQLFREAAGKNDPVALKIKNYADKGELAPNALILKLVNEHISEGNVFDGFPRTLDQAEALDGKVQIDLVIELKLSDIEAVRRISTRMECHRCGAIYGENKKPKKKGACDVCASPVSARDDDKPEAVKKRLARYHEETEPLLEYYRPRNIVVGVDASNGIFECFDDIKRVIEDHLK